MVVEAGLRASSAIFLLTEAGGRDQKQRPSWLSGAKPPGNLEAVHLGQLEVKEDDLGSHRTGHLQGRMPIVRHVSRISQSAAGTAKVYVRGVPSGARRGSPSSRIWPTHTSQSA